MGILDIAFFIIKCLIALALVLISVPVVLLLAMFGIGVLLLPFAMVASLFEESNQPENEDEICKSGSSTPRGRITLPANPISYTTLPVSVGELNREKSHKSNDKVKSYKPISVEEFQKMSEEEQNEVIDLLNK